MGFQEGTGREASQDSSDEFCVFCQEKQPFITVQFSSWNFNLVQRQFPLSPAGYQAVRGIGGEAAGVWRGSGPE